MSQLPRVLPFIAGLFLTATNGQDALKILPQSYQLEFENPNVRVIRVSYAAHQRLPVHDHPRTPTI
jgi:quercetin dioxygenase-like cupin family protein